MGPGARLPESCELRSRNTFRAESPGAKMQFALFFFADVDAQIPNRHARRRRHPLAGRLVPLGHTFGCSRLRKFAQIAPVRSRDSPDGSERKLALCGCAIAVTVVFVAILLPTFYARLPKLYVPQTLRFSFSTENITLELSEMSSF